MKTYTKETAIGTYHALIEHLIGMMNASPEKVFNFAFSGGDVFQEAMVCGLCSMFGPMITAM